MFHLITSNPVQIRNIKSYTDQFILCHIFSEQIIPAIDGTRRNVFALYFQEDMDVTEEDYQDGEDYRYEFHPVANICQALEEIADEIIDQEYEELQKDEDEQDELTVISCCKYQWNQQVAKYITGQFADQESEMECKNFYTMLHIPSTDRLVSVLKSTLGTEFIYPDDPVAFGYAVFVALQGGMR